jgi:endonuclease/exonuclease/phosphatase family metal-dependent hydrolase
MASPYWAADRPSVRHDEPVIRVATYNLYLGADLAPLFDVGDSHGLARVVARARAELDATRFEERARAIAAVLSRERPHLVGLQEVARWTSAPVRQDGSLGAEQVVVDFLPAVLAALDERGCRYDVHAVTPSFAGGLPLDDGTWMSLAGANVTLTRAVDDVRVTAARTTRFGRRHEVVTGIPGVTFPIERGWSAVDVEVDGCPLVFVNTHTEAHDGGARDAQRDELVAALRGVAGPVVVVGDFNAPPETVGMPPAYVDAWTAAGGDPRGGSTCGQDAGLDNPQSRLRDRIDYVWVRGLRVTGCRVRGDQEAERSHPHRLWPSDHACVVADLEA